MTLSTAKLRETTVRERQEATLSNVNPIMTFGTNAAIESCQTVRKVYKREPQVFYLFLFIIKE